MKNWFSVLFRLTLTIVFGVGAILIALALMDNLYDYRSPLSETPPIPGRSFTEPLADRVVFVLIDALRYDTSLKTDVMPVLNELRTQGATAKMISEPPSYSSPGYGTLLTGAWPYLNDAPVFNLDYENFYPLTQDNIFSSAKIHGLKTAFSGFYWFEKLIPQFALDIGFFTPDEDQHADRLVVDAAMPWLKSDDYDLIMIHLDQVDYAGHYEGGPESINWDQAASRVDGLLGEIVAELDFTKDVLLVVSDHGQIDQGGHGGHESITLTEPFVLVGKGVQPGDFNNVLMVDVAPTLAALAGINLPATTQGRALSQMMVLSESEKEALSTETSRQQSQLLEEYAKAIGEPMTYEAINDLSFHYDRELMIILQEVQQSRLNRERLIRFVIILVVFILSIVLFWRWKPSDWFISIVGALTFTGLFHIAYLTIGQRNYSYSSVVSPTQLLLQNGLISILSFAIVWVVFTWRKWKDWQKGQAVSKVLNLVFMAMVVTAIPLIIHILWNGLFASWHLPTLALHYLALLSLIQIFFLSIAGLIFSLITSRIVKNKESLIV
ncbi:MAG: alkaline phosphatase family protein [Anaerolineaceae bacterium]|nr:alkaline phosphatase family protein [Anaerolineaceae bacterium]